MTLQGGEIWQRKKQNSITIAVANNVSQLLSTQAPLSTRSSTDNKQSTSARWLDWFSKTKKCSMENPNTHLSERHYYDSFHGTFLTSAPATTDRPRARSDWFQHKVALAEGHHSVRLPWGTAQLPKATPPSTAPAARHRRRYPYTQASKHSCSSFPLVTLDGQARQPPISTTSHITKKKKLTRFESIRRGT